MNNRVKLLLLLICLLSTGANIKLNAQSSKDQIRVDSNLILASRCSSGSGCTYNWTLTSRLGQALNIAEELFGVRDYSYTILGVDFTTEEQPSHWYPGGRKNIIILLTRACASDERRALFQLSHETFHLLSPTGKLGRATNLEEGLAVYFSLLYMDRIEKPLSRNYISSSKYLRAYDDVIALSRLYPDMAERIRDFRREQSFISAISYREFKRIFPNAPDNLAERLTRNFYDNRE